MKVVLDDGLRSMIDELREADAKGRVSVALADEIDALDTSEIDDLISQLEELRDQFTSLKEAAESWKEPSQPLDERQAYREEFLAGIETTVGAYDEITWALEV